MYVTITMYCLQRFSVVSAGYWSARWSASLFFRSIMASLFTRSKQLGFPLKQLKERESMANIYMYFTYFTVNCFIIFAFFTDAS